MFSRIRPLSWTGKGWLALLSVTAVAAGLAVYAISAALGAPAKPQPAAASWAAAGGSASPTPAEFASEFVASANAYAEAHRRAARLVDPDCVEADPSHYMCSYAVVTPRRPRQCHLVQVTWTPNRASTFTVTLSGRVRRCGTLREALGSLR